MKEPSSDFAPVCARPGCTRPLDPDNTVVYVHATGSLYAHPTCARAAASELGVLALAAVNRARVEGLATRVGESERRWAEKRQISKAEWLRRAREALDIG